MTQQTKGTGIRPVQILQLDHRRTPRPLEDSPRELPHRPLHLLLEPLPLQMLQPRILVSDPQQIADQRPPVPQRFPRGYRQTHCQVLHLPLQRRPPFLPGPHQMQIVQKQTAEQDIGRIAVGLRPSFQKRTRRIHLLHPPRELAQQPRLAQSGFPADPHQPGITHRPLGAFPPEFLQARQLPFSPFVRRRFGPLQALPVLDPAQRSLRQDMGYSHPLHDYRPLRQIQIRPGQLPQLLAEQNLPRFGLALQLQGAIQRLADQTILHSPVWPQYGLPHVQPGPQSHSRPIRYPRPQLVDQFHLPRRVVLVNLGRPEHGQQRLRRQPLPHPLAEPDPLLHLRLHPRRLRPRNLLQPHKTQRHRSLLTP